MNCKNCYQEIPDGSKFCPHCGAKQNEVQPNAEQENAVKNDPVQATGAAKTTENAVGYQDVSGYQNNSGYQDAAGYQNNSGYQDAAGYQNNGGYQDAAGYQNNSGYQNVTGYTGNLRYSLFVMFFDCFYLEAVTDVIWGFTPSYQYRKPSISMTSPIFSSLTALYTSVVLSHR